MTRLARGWTVNEIQGIGIVNPPMYRCALGPMTRAEWECLISTLWCQNLISYYDFDSLQKRELVPTELRVGIAPWSREASFIEEILRERRFISK